MAKSLSFFYLIPIVFGVDRFSKWLVMDRLYEGESIPLVFFFHLTRVNNTGAAFGIFKGSGQLLVATSVLCIILLCGMILRRQSALSSAATALILGGALGNLYDRLRYGYVADFIDLRVWPVFNIADSAISVGIFLIFVEIFLIQKKDRSSASHSI